MNVKVLFKENIITPVLLYNIISKKYKLEKLQQTLTKNIGNSEGLNSNLLFPRIELLTNILVATRKIVI